MTDRLAEIKARHETENGMVDTSNDGIGRAWWAELHGDRAILLAEVARLTTALGAARCPNKNCIDGAYPDGPDREPVECEWCAFRAEALAQEGE